ncbi:ABC transporter substrate-binding protein [Clostridium sp. DJ247]|uniref:ABC transporter substrate-binding protein n=1 Tax=Clostridium sp. DJ247 TaxID=2726188 RepID=UPI001626C04C|nr:extracellular solute-binding protein [Clostridium sp. DJ247]MBC2579439.1 extracellular solute-binding protein [Clostridium sp. DJ247]
MLKKSKTSLILSLILTTLVATSFVGCGTKKDSSQANTNQTETMARPSKEDVKKEGKLVSYGMPNEWANYLEIFKTFTNNYGITHEDTDMSSAEELAKFKAEKDKPLADIGDVGIVFGNIAKSENIVQPYKNTYWKDVPDWAKDKDGYWTGAYTGTIAFLVNKKLVKDVPHSFKDLQNPEYKNSIVVGDMLKAAQSQNALLAAAIANGGDESNLQPGINYFKQLKKMGNIKDVDNRIGNFQKGEIPIGILWDFNALNYRKTMNAEADYEIVIPSDGTVISAYVSIINKYAPHPNAAKAFQDYLFSDEGQINLAKGFAKPIRDVKLPDDVAKQLLPNDAYKSAKPIKDYAAWDKNSKEIPNLWRDNILTQ